MDDQQFILLLVALVALIFVLWSVIGSGRSGDRAQRRAARKALREQKQLEKAKAKAAAMQARAPAAREPAPVDDDERYTGAAARVRRQLQEAALEAQENHERRAAVVDDKLERARRFVEESGVGEAALTVLETMWYWPELTRRGEWVRPAGMHELRYTPPGDVESEDEDGNRSLSWEWMDRPYVMRHEPQKRSIVSVDPAAILSLEVDGEKVLGLDTEPSTEGVPNAWVLTGVDALKTGEWMAEFVEFAGRLKIADEERRRQMGFEVRAQKAERIEMEDTVAEQS